MLAQLGVSGLWPDPGLDQGGELPPSLPSRLSLSRLQTWSRAELTRQLLGRGLFAMFDLASIWCVKVLNFRQTERDISRPRGALGALHCVFMTSES